MNLAAANYAFDKQSSRSIDADGRMRVRRCVISVAEVNPYYGKEIPGWKDLGLDPNRVYDLYRDPEALAAAVDSFNGLPLMIRHIAQTAAEPRKEHQGGSVFNAHFEAPNLYADLLVSDGKAIEYIQSGMLADLSSSYRYKPDMTPGEINGRKYDGRMVAIDGNHVALVEDGRATGAHVADSALDPSNGDTPVDEQNPAPTPSPTDNAELAKIMLDVAAKLESMEGRLEKLEAGGGESVISVDPPDVIADAAINPDAAVDADPDTNAEVADPDAAADEQPDTNEEVAMDSAKVQELIDAAVAGERERAKGVEEAKRAVRADLGDMIAMDSADEIYRAALKQRGVNVDALPAGAERATYEAIRATASNPVVAMDSADRPDVKRVTFDTSNIRNRG